MVQYECPLGILANLDSLCGKSPRSRGTPQMLHLSSREASLEECTRLYFSVSIIRPKYRTTYNHVYVERILVLGVGKLLAEGDGIAIADVA